MYIEADMTTLWRLIRDVSLTINGYFTIQVSVLLFHTLYLVTGKITMV